MPKRGAEFISELVYRKSAVSGHKKQEKSGANHEGIKTAVKITLHGGEINEDDPENIITDNSELVAITDHDKTGNNSPQAQEKGNHRKFDVYIRDRIEN